MKSLRCQGLPKKLTSFTSIETTIKSAVDYRLRNLSSFEGYLVPAHVIARMQSLLKLDSITGLKSGIKQLRDICELASEIIHTIPSVQTFRYQLSRTEITLYVQQNKQFYGFANLTDTDVDLVSYLITSSEVFDVSWALAFPEDKDENKICQIHRLYQAIDKRANAITGLRVETTIDPTTKTVSDVKTASAHVENVGHLYEPIGDRIMPIHELPALQQLISAFIGKSLKTEDLEKQIGAILQREENYLRVADIRLVDHISCLLFNPEIWNDFVPPRVVKQDVGENETRAKGLKLFAAYLHSLLVMPYLMRIELFKSGYERAENWLGNFPTLSSTIEKDYEQYVRAYDVLGVKEDVDGIYAAYHESSDPNLSSEIYTLFKEYTDIFQMSSALSKAQQASIKLNTSVIKDMANLKDKIYDSVMLSHPVAEFDLPTNVISSLFGQAHYKEEMKKAFQSIIPLISRFMSDKILGELRAKNYRVPFPIHASIPVTYTTSKANAARIENGVYHNNRLAPVYSYDFEFALRTELLYTISSASKLINDNPAQLLFHRDRASKLRDLMQRDWMSLYPSSVIMGSEIIDPKSFVRSIKVKMTTDITTRQLIERISGTHYELVARSLHSAHQKVLWATVLSSFAVLYEKKVDLDSKTMDITLSKLSVVEGEGQPYGMTYSGLAALQAHKDSDLIRFTDDFWIGIHSDVPVPSHTISIGQFALGRPYYYYVANKAKIKLKYLCFDKSLLQLASQAYTPPAFDSFALYDKLYGYTNNNMVFIQNLGEHLVPDDTAKYSSSIKVKIQDWKGDKFSPLYELSHIPYSTAQGELASVGVIKSETTELGELVDQMKTSMENAEVDTVDARMDGLKTEVALTVNDNVKSQSAKKKSKSQVTNDSSSSSSPDDDKGETVES